MEPLTGVSSTDVIAALAVLVGIVVIIFKSFFLNSKKNGNNRNQDAD